jgi:hypothetical protein
LTNYYVFFAKLNCWQKELQEQAVLKTSS